MNKKISFGIGNIFDILIYGLAVLIFAVLQTTLLPRFKIYDCIPDIAIGVIAYLGIYRGEKHAALFGLAIGLCYDGLGNFGVSFLPLFYLVAGFICGHIGSAARERARFAAFLVTIPAFCVCRSLLTLLDCFIKYTNTLDIKQFLLYTALPEAVAGLLLCIPAMLAVRFIEIPLNIARRKGWID